MQIDFSNAVTIEIIQYLKIGAVCCISLGILLIQQQLLHLLVQPRVLLFQSFGTLIEIGSQRSAFVVFLFVSFED